MPLRRAAAALLALPLAACVSVLPQSGDLAPRLSLDAGLSPAPSGEPLGVTLAIADPRAERVFDSSGVVVRTEPLQYEYLADAEWTDRAPLLLGLFLERRFEGTGRFDAVGDRVALPVADYTLLTDIRAMNLDRTDGARRAVMAYGARLINRRGQTLGTRVFEARADQGAQGHGSAAQAMNAAAREVADATLSWATPLIEADKARQAEAEAARQERRRPRG